MQTETQKKLIGEITGDAAFMSSLREIAMQTFRPIQQETAFDFDYRRSTRFIIPDNMHQRLDTMIEVFANQIAKRLLPEIEREAASEARHQLIRKLGEVMA